MYARHLILSVILAFGASASFAQGQDSSTQKLFKSAGKPVQFIELYTSQGCYSCPPAERWLNKFAGSPKLWDGLIPINLHVDYWDYLGYEDPFALSDFSTRQRRYERLGHTSNVATPGFVVNGEGWNGWFWGRSVPRASKLEGGELTLATKQGSYQLAYQSEKHSTEGLEAHVAILGFGIETDIPNGENAGKTLKHDFVVVGYQRAKLTQQGGAWHQQISKPKLVDTPMSRQAVVAWVTANNDPKPLQVTAGWL